MSDNSCKIPFSSVRQKDVHALPSDRLYLPIFGEHPTCWKIRGTHEQYEETHRIGNIDAEAEHSNDAATAPYSKDGIFGSGRHCRINIDFGSFDNILRR